jgi:hypothetical protein
MLGNSITITDQEQLEAFFINVQESFNKNKRLEFKTEAGNRTLTQNKAMHLYFKLVSEALVSAGIDTTNFFKEGYSLPFSEHIVKTELWYPLMRAITNKESTRGITTKEVTEIYEHLNAKLAEHGVQHIPFPSNDSMMNAQRK